MTLDSSWKELVPFPTCKNTMSKKQFVTWKRVLTRSWPCWHPDIGLSASRTMRNKCPLFISHSVYSTLLQRAEWTETMSQQVLGIMVSWFKNVSDYLSTWNSQQIPLKWNKINTTHCFMLNIIWKTKIYKSYLAS